MLKKEEVLNIFNTRFACREFKDKKIPNDILNTILEVARLSPTSMGTELWKLLVISSNEAKEKLAKTDMWGAKKSLPTCSHFLILLRASYNTASFTKENEYAKHIMYDIKKVDDETYEKLLKKASDYQKNDLDLTDTNDVTRIEAWAAHQTYIVLTNIMMAAAMLDVNSCPIEGFNYARVSEILSKDFNVDLNKYKPSVMVALGYKQQDTIPPKNRRDIKEIVEFF